MNVDAEVSFDNIHAFMIKMLNKSYIEGMSLSIIKAIYQKPTVNIMHNGENLKSFPLLSGTVQGCPLLPCLFNVVLDPNLSFRQENEIKNIHIRKEEVKLSLFRDYVILYIKNPKYSAKKLPE